jgi:hypothetical protein
MYVKENAVQIIRNKIIQRKEYTGSMGDHRYPKLVHCKIKVVERGDQKE